MKRLMSKIAIPLLASLLGCALEAPRPVPSTPDPPEDWPSDLLGRACETNEECTGALGVTCARLLGVGTMGVCTLEGCEPGMCPVGSRCQSLGESRVCMPGEDGFCSTNCGQPLECALKLECLEQGCCGSGPCPSVCAELSHSDCEMNARCSVSCCQVER